MYRTYKDICKDQNNVKTDRTIFSPILDESELTNVKEKYEDNNRDIDGFLTELPNDKRVIKKEPGHVPIFVENMVDKYNEHSKETVATDPNVWGPKAWDFLHTVSFAYPNNPSYQQRQSAMNFFMALPDMLPCKMCGDHCRENLQKNPPRVENKDSISRWLVDFHNDVNKHTNEQNSTHKKEFTYEEAKKLYDAGMCYHTMT